MICSRILLIIEERDQQFLSLHVFEAKFFGISKYSLESALFRFEFLTFIEKSEPVRTVDGRLENLLDEHLTGRVFTQD